MIEWLIGHAVDGLYSLLTRTLLRPMLWSGEQIRCAREEIRAAEISVHNAQQQSLGATPTEQFFQYRRRRRLTMGLHAAFWLVLLFSAVLLFGSGGFACALLAAAVVVAGYFTVEVSGMPTRVETRRE